VCRSGRAGSAVVGADHRHVHSQGGHGRHRHCGSREQARVPRDGFTLRQVEDQLLYRRPKGAEVPDFQTASSTSSSSKFIFAGEAAFAAGSDLTIGVGGWYNTLGEADVRVFEFDFPNATAFFGFATEKLSVSELHGNAFYKSLGIQVGLVRTSVTLTGFRAGSEVVDLDTGDVIVFDRDVTLSEAGLAEEKFTTTNWDAFLVYKKTAPSGSNRPWGLSVGAGMYRDTEAQSSVFSGFVTGSVGIWRGLDRRVLLVRRRQEADHGPARVRGFPGRCLAGQHEPLHDRHRLASRSSREAGARTCRPRSRRRRDGSPGPGPWRARPPPGPAPAWRACLCPARRARSRAARRTRPAPGRGAGSG